MKNVVEVEEKVMKKEEDIRSGVYSAVYFGVKLLLDPGKLMGVWNVYCGIYYISHFLVKKLELIGLRFILFMSLIQEGRNNKFKCFLKSSFIEGIASFTVKFDNKQRASQGRNLRCIFNFLPKITDQLIINNCAISKNQFRKLLLVGRHIKVFKFNNCDMSFDEFFLSKSIHYSIKSINFTFTDDSQSKTPETRLKTLTNFLKAASKTDLSLSLEHLSTNNSTLTSQLQKSTTKTLFTSLTIFST
ncbi:unnamed protein product [Moneuplotes crassus]|uniref:Uncharacterized protein n=1 Tax=Euplotes crassus TaxID=5936 RepID=A0AAD1XXM5_EUPCR|nr:unnamed protein product [Moneuplotes crassus]